MRTISFKTFLTMDGSMRADVARVEYTPLREPKSDDLILTVTNPGEKVISIIKKMESKTYKFIPQENGDRFVHIYHKTLPEFEQCELLNAAQEDKRVFDNHCSYGEMKPEEIKDELA